SPGKGDWCCQRFREAPTRRLLIGRPMHAPRLSENSDRKQCVVISSGNSGQSRRLTKAHPQASVSPQLADLTTCIAKSRVEPAAWRKESGGPDDLSVLLVIRLA